MSDEEAPQQKWGPSYVLPFPLSTAKSGVEAWCDEWQCLVCGRSGCRMACIPDCPIEPFELVKGIRFRQRIELRAQHASGGDVFACAGNQPGDVCVCDNYWGPVPGWDGAAWRVMPATPHVYGRDVRWWVEIPKHARAAGGATSVAAAASALDDAIQTVADKTPAVVLKVDFVGDARWQATLRANGKSSTLDGEFFCTRSFTYLRGLVRGLQALKRPTHVKVDVPTREMRTFLGQAIRNPDDRMLGSTAFQDIVAAHALTEKHLVRL